MKKFFLSLVKDYERVVLILFIFLSVALRFYSNNWDGGTHQHPDERMAVMVSMRLNFFDQLDPDFFNYGSLPFYVLQGLAQLLDGVAGVFKGDLDYFYYRSYDQLLVLGRVIASLLDVATMVVVYHISLLLFKKKNLALLSSFFYGMSFFPIQNSNFYIVDNYVNLLSSLLFLVVLKIWSKATLLSVAILGLLMGALIASKLTPIIYLPIIVLFIFLKLSVQDLLKTSKRVKDILPLNKTNLFKAGLANIFTGFNKQLFLLFFFYVAVFLLVAVATFAVFMPYGLIHFERFVSDIGLQLRMNSDPYIFPYTLQYVSTQPYLYYVKNIFLWGFGPFAFTLFLIGLLLLVKSLLLGEDLLFNSTKKKAPSPLLILTYLALNSYYFLVLGRSAVKFMRYMLPLYPFMAVVAAYGLYYGLHKIQNWMRSRAARGTVFLACVLVTSLWTFSFYQIYLHPNTRLEASDWIKHNINSGSVLAVEHWDDRLPLFVAGNYEFAELPLYNYPDSYQKWQTISQDLKRADYIILASNRLYEPLVKLRDCNQFEKCYPLTAKYYDKLFSGQLGFTKVAEFASFPTIPVLNIEISDTSADESFTVYDHPKVMIFKRTGSVPRIVD